MPASTLELHPDALDDALAGYGWYLQHSARAADGFFAELERAVQLILEGPLRWALHVHGTRRLVLTKYPYSVVYKTTAGVVVVYAFAHAKRRPGYWKGRLDWSPPVA